ncbi:MAG: hypothetical protein U1E23_14780 [Reyranellaceae bacterium]
MASFNKHNAFVENLPEKVHNLESDTLRLLLTNAAPLAANAVKADLTEISAGNGYTAGGTQTSQTSSAQSGGTYKLICADVVFTASGGAIGPFRYVDIYNDTPTSPADPLIGWWDYGSSITLASGETFTADLDGTNGVLQLQ